MKRFLNRCGIGVLLACALTLSTANAQEARVGVVNLDRIFKEAGAAKAAQTRLEQEFTKREKEVNDLGTAVKAAADKLDKEAPTLSEGQKIARQKQLVEMDRDFQRKRREVQEDSAARKNEEMQQLIDRANRVVRQIAETEKYDLILQDAVFVSPKLDITDKVIKALNATSPK